MLLFQMMNSQYHSNSWYHRTQHTSHKSILHSENNKVIIKIPRNTCINVTKKQAVILAREFLISTESNHQCELLSEFYPGGRRGHLALLYNFAIFASQYGATSTFSLPSQWTSQLGHTSSCNWFQNESLTVTDWTKPFLYISNHMKHNTKLKLLRLQNIICPEEFHESIIICIPIFWLVKLRGVASTEELQQT